MTSHSESALVAAVPEAEELVQDFRARYDPTAVAGIPAHVTVLYPFKPPAELNADVFRSLGELFATFNAFQVAFRETRQLPGVLYLAPVPDAPFRELTKRVARRFPETPPYGGQFADIVPHLTVAQTADPEELEAIATDFERAARKRLPIRAKVSEIILIDNESSYWLIRARFALGIQRKGAHAKQKP